MAIDRGIDQANVAKSLLRDLKAQEQSHSLERLLSTSNSNFQTQSDCLLRFLGQKADEWNNWKTSNRSPIPD